MTDIVSIKQIHPYYLIASRTAKLSPCDRRQYGAVVIDRKDGMNYAAECNSRQSRCCNTVCARTRMQFRNGERVEVGAEVHAETAAIIAFGGTGSDTAVMVLAGFSGNRELLSEDAYPCHTCALNIKFAGIKWVYIKDRTKNITPVLTSEIIKYREAEWEPVD